MSSATQRRSANRWASSSWPPSPPESASIYAGGLSGIVGAAVASLIGFLVWSLIVWLVGTKLMPEPATKADYPETFRVLGFAAAPGLASVLTIVGIVPILGWLAALLIGS